MKSECNRCLNVDTSWTPAEKRANEIESLIVFLSLHGLYGKLLVEREDTDLALYHTGRIGSPVSRASSWRLLKSKFPAMRVRFAFRGSRVLRRSKAILKVSLPGPPGRWKIPDMFAPALS